MTTALIMAGGRSERMRASLGAAHKALVRIRGLTLLEWNLHAVFASGIRKVVVAVSEHEAELQCFANSVGASLAARVGGTFVCRTEKQPRGTIGIAGDLRGQDDSPLVVNVDNLTAIDLAALVEHHRRSGVAMTIATHVEPFRIPFGEVVVNDGWIAQYLEKSVHNIPISSGTYVLGEEAMRRIPANRRVDVPELVRLLAADGYSIASYRHDMPWIDVNDAAAVQRAERLVEDHRHSFEYCLSSLCPSSPASYTGSNMIAEGAAS